MHAKLTPGRFTKVDGIGGGHGRLEENLSWLDRASQFGQPCADWAQGLVERRGPTAIRSLIGLIGLTEMHSFKALNRACEPPPHSKPRRIRD